MLCIIYWVFFSLPNYSNRLFLSKFFVCLIFHVAVQTFFECNSFRAGLSAGWDIYSEDEFDSSFHCQPDSRVFQQANLILKLMNLYSPKYIWNLHFSCRWMNLYTLQIQHVFVSRGLEGLVMEQLIMVLLHLLGFYEYWFLLTSWYKAWWEFT